VNARVKKDAKAAGALTNIADDPEGSDFQVPSFFEDGPLRVAVSTGGVSPAVSRALRRLLQAYVGDRFGEALIVIEKFRARVKRELKDSKQRVKFWEAAITPETLELARVGDLAGIRARLKQTLVRFKGKTIKAGKKIKA